MSLRAQDVVNPEGLRLDGRRPTELRKIEGKINVDEFANGSAILSHGQTKVSVKVFGPYENKGRSQSKLNLKVEVIMAPYATVERKHRNDRRIAELSYILEESFKEVVLCSLFPRSCIDIQVCILCNDGGILHCCINGITLALIDAGIPMIDFVCASSAGYVDKYAVLDLNSLEESGQFDLPKFTIAVMPRTQKVLTLNLECRMPMDKFELVKDLALEGATQVKQVLDDIVKDSLN